MGTIINLIINCALLIVGLIAIKKISFFTTKLNKKKLMGKKFATAGCICIFGSKCLFGIIFQILVIAEAYAIINTVSIVNSIVYYIGIALLVLSAIFLYQGAKLEPDEATNEKPKKISFTANEEMSQKAQYAYANFKNEYEQGAAAIDEVAEAKMFAKAVELQLLKTPASAVFCSMEEMSVLPIGDGAYSVSGYVDSQNSYGAMLRNQFNLTVFKDENGIWKNANKFISNAASINNTIVSTTILWWVLGIIGTIITLAVSYAFTSSLF